MLLYGSLNFVIMFLGFVLVDKYSGGCMFVIPIYFMVLMVAVPVMKLQKFGAGIAVFIPYTVVGFIMDYYYEIVLSPTLTSVWGVVGWCLMGPLVGLSADLAQRFLPHKLNESWRGAVIGAITGLMFYLTTLLALSTFYNTPSMESHYRFFTQGVLFTLTWMIINGVFSGFTAYAITSGKGG